MPSPLAAAAGSRLPLLNFTAHHQGSRFRLFVQMSYANSALWQVNRSADVPARANTPQGVW